MLREKSPGHQAERSDVTERTNEKKRAPAQPVNQPQADKSKDQIGHADADGLQQRGLRTQTSQLKNARREIKNRIDAGKLVEKRDEDGQQDRPAQPPRPEMRRG